MNLKVRLAVLEARMAERDKALKVQAKEYERRLEALNHAHEQAIQVQHTYVTEDKFEAQIKAESLARSEAVDRVNERFNDHVRRYEDRHQELSDEMVAMRANNAAVQHLSEEQGRRQSRNLALATVVISVVVALANFVVQH